jgi:purine-nucleoside phosphorylase
LSRIKQTGLKGREESNASTGHQEMSAQTDKYTDLVRRCRTEIERALGLDLPRLALVLGSGFQSIVSGFRVLREVSYSALPGFPEPHVPGHPGTLYLAEIEGLRCLICAGRAHFYEGHEMAAVTYPTRMLAECGVEELILTNAAGGINRAYRPGDFMLATDHINFMGVNPLRGAFPQPNFVDLSGAYSPLLRHELRKSARNAKIAVHEGVYLAVSGPSYETPAEIRAFRAMGADAVGMSTVPEAVMARACGLSVAAISCITNPAAGLRKGELSHEEVLRTGRESAEGAAQWLKAFAQGRVSKDKLDSPRKNLKNRPPEVGSASRKR